MVPSRISLSSALLLLVPILVCRSADGNDVYKAQSKLLSDLFKDYDKASHPSPEIGIPVNVTLGIAITQIVKVDEKSEGMHLNNWYRMKWKDYRLAWDPTQYQNLTEFKIDSDNLWTPDIMLYEPMTSDAAHVLGVTRDVETDLSWKITVYSDGAIAFNFPGMIYGQCSLNIANYPYDEHSCSFLFASWAHDGSEMNFKTREGNPLDLGNYIQNNEWHITGSGYENYQQKYECCPEVFYMVIFKVSVRRGASSYVSNYIIPSVIIVILSIMMFTLPPEVGKRMEIGINLLLCLSVYLTIVNTKMPTRSDVFPLLSKFYGCCIFILTCALLCTCWVVAYYFHDMSGWQIYAMPKFVQVGVLHYLAKLLRVPNARKVYPSDLLDTGDGKEIIVKPVEEQQTDFTAGAKFTNPAAENKNPNEDCGESRSERNGNGANDVSVNVDKTTDEEDRQKVKHRKRSREETSDHNDAEKKGRKPSKPDSVDMASVKNQEARDDGQNIEASSHDTRRKMSKNNVYDDKAEHKEHARKDSKEISQDQHSKKANRVFASSVSPGLMEPSRKSRRRKKNIVQEVGVDNQGKDEENTMPKKAENNNARKESNDGKPREKEPVREAPSLEGETGTISKTERENGNDSFDRKVTEDFGFDAGGHKAKEHDSVRRLRELAEHYGDNTQRKKNRYQWRLAATIMNRLFLILLIFSILVSIVAVLG